MAYILLRVIVITGFLEVTCGRLNVNIALNRPTWQVTTYGTQTSSFAVDGSKVGTCAGSYSGMTNPWWVVDLGEPCVIRGISFTNVPDTTNAYRVNNFVVGLTNVSPQVTEPVLWKYAVCGQYPGAVPASATVYLPCTNTVVSYRYLIVQITASDCFNACEIEVYPKALTWTRRSGFKLSLVPIRNVTVESFAACALTCRLDDACDSVNYRPDDSTCQLIVHADPLNANMSSLVSDTNWEWWHPTYMTLV